ncbi:SusD/RagB family nutrient-binding outer membrane lipoprotein [Chitinophaga qingshengii]|uniref:SusD/RagB family nutrient-binding outer membrane lipoprotein n=1 Tax=Chitinophaga qingshengii TaxID=1569794 RepID=A0ABR7TLI3_9BACT|nr:SusD/RagB family nutrient-binding outer membrane lipoprotein [Chitinophaga qingshengii]MBC9931357.1 SusD/RagB family nutrient-binding outer membrane lipoprotein [Chitinophaga qingshengii]
MKHWRYIMVPLVALSFTACTDKIMDDINKNRNDAENVLAANELPAVTTETAFSTVGTDMAWYTSVFVELNTGTHGQMRDADLRVGVTASSLMNNSWNAVYDNMMILQDIIKKCSPGGAEAQNTATLGIGQVLMAYNLAVVTDMWGQVPFNEALKGLDNRHPKYDKQQDIYTKVIIPYLDAAIANFAKPVDQAIINKIAENDLILEGDMDKWVKAAWSLKMRYYLHLSGVMPDAADKALACLPNGIDNALNAFIFDKYQPTATGENPWFQHLKDRKALSTSKTLYDLMNQRNDPRIAAYFEKKDGQVVPAPNGTALESQGTLYSTSKLSLNRTAPTPLMSYHEVKFIEAELLARKGQDFRPALQAAIEANFAYHGVTGGADYYNNKVVPLLGNTQAANLQEIMTQKYIAFYEAEAIEAYNDYRRTRIPTLNNPNNNNAAYGFLERFPYPTTETSNNGANVPKVNIFRDKIWWAGGTE